jgi:hypothetical protein
MEHRPGVVPVEGVGEEPDAGGAGLDAVSEPVQGIGEDGGMVEGKRLG